MPLEEDAVNGLPSEDNGGHINEVEHLSTNDNREDLMKLITDTSKKFGQNIKRIYDFVLIDLGGYQILDRFAQWCVQNPQIALCVLAAGLVVSLPILLFMAFALSTFVMTLTGFLVLEGTILTIITMIMLGILSALGIALLFFALVGLATYFGLSQVYDMYGSTKAPRKIPSMKK